MNVQFINLTRSTDDSIKYIRDEEVIANITKMINPAHKFVAYVDSNLSSPRLSSILQDNFPQAILASCKFDVNAFIPYEIQTDDVIYSDERDIRQITEMILQRAYF